jgi:hypothetical protein
MDKGAFKKLASEEFGVEHFSKPEHFKKMEEVFGTPGRTFQGWIHKDNVRPYFDKAVELYLENKRLNKELLRLTQEFVKISERIENI